MKVMDNNNAMPVTKQQVNDALEIFEDLPEGAQWNAAAEHLGLENASDLVDILDPEGD